VVQTLFFFIFQSLVWERRDKVLDFNSRERKSSLTSISNIKMVNLGVNMFYLVMRVLLRCFSLLNCLNQYIWVQTEFWMFQVDFRFFDSFFEAMNELIKISRMFSQCFWIKILVEEWVSLAKKAFFDFLATIMIEIYEDQTMCCPSFKKQNLN